MSDPRDIAGYALPDSDKELLGECDVDVFRATGPGGQGVNTTESAVRLTHRPTGIVVVCRRERSQHLNKQACLKRLRERIREAQHVQTPRVRTAVPAGAKRRRVERKRLVAHRKRLRRRPGIED